MTAIPIFCSLCRKKFFRNRNHINENKKLHQQYYCSLRCSGLSRKKQRVLVCENPQCNKVFNRQTFAIAFHNYCSRSCAATVNNSKFPKNPGIKKNCAFCQKIFVSKEKYCSRFCKIKAQTISSEVIVTNIKNFYHNTGRVPLKREFRYATSARKRFSSWNNAIKAAGFTPNPIIFAKKYLAEDGHKCDSLAEKIIDDWLYKRSINHKRAVRYPENKTLTVDFVVDKHWIEFFGLYGEHRRYDELRKEKLALAKKYKLNLIELYPTDLFPINKLNIILTSLINSL